MGTVCIIYGEDSGIIRRLVQTDDLSVLPQFVEDGEASINVSDAVLVQQPDGSRLPALDLATDAVEAVRGLPSEPARCLVIDQQGNVVNVIMADPTLDHLDGFTLFQDANGQIGWVPDGNGNFVDPNPPVPPEDDGADQ